MKAKTCVICEISFTPKSGRAKTCPRAECKRLLRKQSPSRSRKEMARQRRNYYAANAGRVLANNKRWRSENPTKVREGVRDWAARNPDKVVASNKKYHQANKSTFRKNSALYRARKFSATPSWVDLEALSLVYQRCPDGLHVDHIVPLAGAAVSGLHVPWNLQYLKPAENFSKNNRYNQYQN